MDRFIYSVVLTSFYCYFYLTFCVVYSFATTCNFTRFSCSNQVKNMKQDECLIMRLNSSTYSDCLSNFLSNHQNKENFYVENDFFHVVPKYYQRQLPDNRSFIALNITFNFNSENKQILIWIEMKNYVSCRLLSFNKSLQNIWSQTHKHIMLWYDCHFFKSEAGMQYKFIITQFPQQIKHTFYSKVIDIDNFGDNFSKWEFPIFVEHLESKNSVNVMFSEIPKRFGVFNYTVALLKDRTVVEEHHILPIALNSKETDARIYRVNFKNLIVGGNYTVAVRTFNDTTSSSRFKETFSLPIIIINENSNTFPVYLVLIGVLVAIVLFTIIIKISKLFMTTRSLPNEEMEVLVLYSHDNQYHLALVDAFVQLLKSRNFIVYFDKEEMFWNPYEWLRDHIAKENIRILLIWSSGAIHKAQQNTNSLLLLDEPGHLTSHLFNLALKMIQSTKHYTNIINILWDKTKLPEVIKVMPEMSCYVLPKEWLPLLHHLCHLLQNRQRCDCCCATESLHRGSLKTFPQGVAFLKAHAIMCEEGDYFEIIHRKSEKDLMDEKTDISNRISEQDSKNSGTGQKRTISVVNENFTGNPKTAEEHVLMHSLPKPETVESEDDSDSESSSSDDEQEEGWLRNFLAV